NYSWWGAMLVLGAVQLHLRVWYTAEATHCCSSLMSFQQLQADSSYSHSPKSTMNHR
ncbi:Monocarboxylate transporter 11, partial [Clarias magur]